MLLRVFLIYWISSKKWKSATKPVRIAQQSDKLSVPALRGKMGRFSERSKSGCLTLFQLRVTCSSCLLPVSVAYPPFSVAYTFLIYIYRGPRATFNRQSPHSLIFRLTDHFSALTSTPFLRSISTVSVWPRNDVVWRRFL